MPARSRAGSPLLGLEHFYRRALNALRTRLPDALFAQDCHTQMPNRVVDLAEGSFGKFGRWCNCFFASGDIFRCAIDLILGQRSEDSLYVLNLGNAMADHSHVVSSSDREANCVLEPKSCKNRSHIQIVSHNETIETEFAAQQIGNDPM